LSRCCTIVSPLVLTATMRLSRTNRDVATCLILYTPWECSHINCHQAFRVFWSALALPLSKMASSSVPETESSFRHRIQGTCNLVYKTDRSITHYPSEITLHPTPSTRPIELELSADDITIHVLPTIEPGQLLQWDMRLLPWLVVCLSRLCQVYRISRCSDVHLNSRITLKITKKNRISSDRVRLADYLISDVADQTSITINANTQASRSLSFVSTAKRSRTSSQNDSVTVTLKFWGWEEVSHVKTGGHNIDVLHFRWKTRTPQLLLDLR
jgi:hypothetical protein